MPRPRRSDLADNPVRQARLRLSLTIKAISSRAQVQEQLWYLTECGCYSEIPPSVLSYLIEKEFSPNFLREGYNAFVSRKRRDFGEKYLHDKFELPEPSPRVEPISALRTQLGLTRTSFAKDLCIQPAILYKVENAKQRTLSQVIKNALLEAGLELELIRELDMRYGEYYDRRHFRLST